MCAAAGIIKPKVNMTTIKVKFRASAQPGKAGTLNFQVCHNRVVRQIHAGYKLYPHEWNAAESEILIPPECGAARGAYLADLGKVVAADTSRLSGIIDRLESGGLEYHTDQVVELYNATDGSCYFISFAESLVDRMTQIGKCQTAGKYATSLNSFGRFRCGHDVAIGSIDSGLMQAYEQWLMKNGVCKNTTSFYMRNLRAIYNRAVELELTAQKYPFRHVYTGVDKTVKRALPAMVIRKIKNLDLSRTPKLALARDLFMFSFYTRGMSFIDMAFLHKKDLRGGILSYRRKKTGELLFVKWERPMQEIIDRYDTGAGPYLLPIIGEGCADPRKQYISVSHAVNYRLRKLGERMGLGIPLTSYVARHSWASIAKSKNIPVSTISEAMGHDSEKTTRIYLASLDTSSVDKANSIVMSML